MSCGSPVSGPIIPLYVGDLIPIYVVDASTCDGPVDWTGWHLTFNAYGPVTITGDAVATPDGVVTYTWISGDTDIPGDYEVIFVGIAPDGRQRTFPARGVVRIFPQYPGAVVGSGT